MIVSSVSSIWSLQDQPPSLLRDVLNALIQAIYPAWQTATTVDQILGAPNDVVVTQASQINGVPSGHYFTAGDLAHTGVPFAGAAGFVFKWFNGTKDSNANVLDSAVVNEAVRCFILKEGDRSCVQEAALVARSDSRPPAPTNAGVTPARPFLAAERVTFGPVLRAVLGQPLRIPTRISGRGLAAGITELVLFQGYEDGEIRGGGGPASLQQAGGATYVEIVPQRLGRTEFTVVVRFDDGGLAFASATSEVRPPEEPPLTFKANSLPVLAMVLDSAEAVARLHPSAAYPGIAGEIPVPVEFLRFTVVPTKGPVPFSVRPNGLIRAHGPGEAAIEVRFGSAVAQIPVFVRQERP
jgi:hypothetical protein